MENCVYKPDFTENAFNCFKQALLETSWDSVKNLQQPNEAYHIFLEIFTELYKEYFPVRKIKIDPKRALSPQITNGMATSYKRKQKLYENFLKHRTPINEANYKAYKTCLKLENANLKNGLIRKNYFSSTVIPRKHGAS